MLLSLRPKFNQRFHTILTGYVLELLNSAFIVIADTFGGSEDSWLLDQAIGGRHRED